MKPGLPLEIPSDKLAWLAGILEGEGSFMMSRNIVNKKLYHYPKITVNMTDRDIIERVATIFGVSVYSIPPTKRERDKKPAFRASVQGVKAATLMQQLLPWMGERRSAKIVDILDQYGNIESTEVRRKRACQEAYKRRKLNALGQFESAVPIE